MEAQPLNRQEVKCYNHLIHYYYSDIEQCRFYPSQIAHEFRVRSTTQAEKVLTRLWQVGLLTFHAHYDSQQERYWNIWLTVKGRGGRVAQ